MTTKEHTDLETLSHNLLWLRKKYGYSQRTMAQLLKIGIGSLRKLEHGEIPPRMTIDILFEVQSRFRITPSDLLTVWME